MEKTSALPPLLPPRREDSARDPTPMPPGLDTEKSDSESKINTEKPDSDGSFQKLPEE